MGGVLPILEHTGMPHQDPSCPFMSQITPFLVPPADSGGFLMSIRPSSSSSGVVVRPASTFNLKA